MHLDRVVGSFAVARLDANVGWPHWMTWSQGFSAITRTAVETTIVCEDRLVPEGVRAERGFSAYVVRDPLDFSAVGILARLSNVLADAGVPLMAYSTFDTDVILVRATSAAAAARAWRGDGITVDD